MIAEMLADPITSRIAVRYLIDKVSPYVETPLIGDSEALEEYRIEKALGELRHILTLPEIAKSLEPRLRHLADGVLGYADTVGLAVDDPRLVRAWVYLFIPLEEQAEYTWWEIDRLVAEHAYIPMREIGALETIGKRIIMNLNIYMEIKSMALSGGDVSQEEILSFEQAIVGQMAKAREIIQNFHS